MACVKEFFKREKEREREMEICCKIPVKRGEREFTRELVSESKMQVWEHE